MNKKYIMKWAILLLAIFVLGIFAFPAMAYTVNFYTTNGGTITFAGKTYSDGQSDQYQAGTYTAIANPPSGYAFSAWAIAGGVSVSDKYSKSTQVTISGDGNLIASFQPIVKFRTNPPNLGSITITGTGRNTGTYTHGQSAVLDQDCLNCYTVIANPPSDYVFAGWEVSGSLLLGNLTSKSTSLVVKGPGTLTAKFAEKSISKPSLEIIEPKENFNATDRLEVLFIITNGDNYIEFKQSDPYNRIDLEMYFVKQNIGVVLWSTSYEGLTLSPKQTVTKKFLITSQNLPQEVGSGGEVILRLVHWKMVSGGYNYGEFGKHEINGVFTISQPMQTPTPLDNPPSIKIVEPSNAQTFKMFDDSIKIGIRARATDDVGINKVEFYVNGNLVATDYDEPFEIEKEFSAGTYTITAKVYDTSNQIGKDSVTIYVEKIDSPPNVRIVSPADDQTFTTENSVEIEIVAEAQDDHGISKVEFYVDGVHIGADYSEPYKVRTELYGGAHTIVVKAYDTSGQTDTDSVTVKVIVVTPTPFVDVKISKIHGGNLAPEELRRSYVSVYVRNYGNVDTSCKVKVEVSGVNKFSEEQSLSVKSGEETNVAFYLEDLPLDEYRVKAWLYCDGELKDFKEKVIKIGYAAPTPTPIPTPTPAPTQTPSRGATVTFEYETSTSTLSLGIDSPSKVKDAQIKISIPQGSTISSSECGGFLSGCTYLHAGTEHRWFVLRKSGSGGKLGWLTLKLTLPEGYSIKDVKLVGIDLKDVNGVPIQVNATFPTTPRVSKPYTVSKLSVPAKLEYLSVSVEPKSVIAKAGDTVKYKVIIDWSPRDWSGKLDVSVLVSSAVFEKRFTLPSIEINGTPPVEQSITFTLPRELPPLNYTVKLEMSTDSVKASDVTEVKVKTPGFEVLFGLIATVLALGIRKIKL